VLPDDLVARLARRANDPAGRTDALPMAHGYTVTAGPLSVVGLDLGKALWGETDPRPPRPET
jgi:hypothetical protein